MSDFVQKQAIDFTLKDQSETSHSLSDYKGKWVLLYFYPKDMTPGCTLEAQGFQNTLNEFRDMNVQVLGVSADTCESHKIFAQRHHLNFPLLADTDHAVCSAYGVYDEKNFFGNMIFGIRRESFLINPEGLIVKHYEKVDPQQHIGNVLADVRSLSGANDDEAKKEEW